MSITRTLQVTRLYRQLICNRCYHILGRNLQHDYLQQNQDTLNDRMIGKINIISKRTIVYHEGLANRGFLSYATGFGEEQGLQNFGYFDGMEEFMKDYVPDLLLNVTSVLPEFTLLNPWPSVFVAHAFDNLQYVTGLPWFATIALSAVIVKLSLYPFHIWWRTDMQGHMLSAPSQIGAFLKAYFDSVSKFSAEEAISRAYQARDAICNQNNIPKFPSLFPIYATAVLPVVTILGLYYLTNLTYEPLVHGGALWFSNLAEPDPFYILPVINSLLIIANARLHPFGFLLPYPVFIVGFKFQAPLAVLALSQLWFSSALMVYFISSNFVGLIIQLMLRTEIIRTHHGLLNKETVLGPFLEQSEMFGNIGLQIGESKKKYLEARMSEKKLLKEPALSAKEND